MISSYKIMWLVVVFDLPVGSKTERRRATGFRNMLIEEGFMMKQFSPVFVSLGSPEFSWMNERISYPLALACSTRSARSTLSC